MSIPPLIIGNRYLVPDQDGQEVEGELLDAVVSRPEETAYCTYKLDDGRQIIVTAPLSLAELDRYDDDPDNFFGVYKPAPKQAKSYEDFHKLMMDSYRDTPKDKLLEFMADQPDIEELKKRSRAKLVEIYCERGAVAMSRDSQIKKKMH